MDERQKQILSIRFNQDKSCFVCCMEKGLRIYNLDPLVEKLHYEEATIGSIGFCEMVYRSNLLWLVSGGSRPKYAENSVMLYDDCSKRAVMEFTFDDRVLGVRCKRDRLVVVLRNRLHVFSYPNKPEKLMTIPTRDNPRGLCELAAVGTSSQNLLIFPGFRIGSLQLVNLTGNEGVIFSSPGTLNAHQGELACLGLNSKGTIIATASDKGTLIRVWDAAKKEILTELRRGSDPAMLYSISFSQDSDFLCCSSDKGTIHIFALKNQTLNKRSSFSKMGFLGQYGESQYSMASFTLPPECACICAFSTHNSVIAICMDGTFHKYGFNADGTCSRLCYDVFLDLCCEDDF